MYLYQHMLIHVDSRERKLIPILRSMCEDSDRIESMTLDLGDIVILNDENKEDQAIQVQDTGVGLIVRNRLGIVIQAILRSHLAGYDLRRSHSKNLAEHSC